VANVAIVCPSCGKHTRVGYKIDGDGTKVRVCKKCGGEMP
jgi:large subunit ribosomal protein L24